MARYVGLDVHSKTSTFEVQDERGAVVSRGTVTTSAAGLERLLTVAGVGPETPVCLECGTVSFHVADLLRSLGLVPIVVDAGQVRRFSSRPEQKSDRRDARELATGLRTEKYSAIIAVPPPNVRWLREALSRRRHFIRARTTQINAAKRLLRSCGRLDATRSLQSLRGWQRMLAETAPTDPLRGHLERHHHVWACLREQIQAVDAELAALETPFRDELDRLMTTPSVGRITASTFYAVVFDAHRFPSGKRLAGYLGLIPRSDQSGDRDRRGSISKKGSRELRAMLCEAAQHAGRRGSPFQPYYRKVLHKHGYKRAVIAVAHRLARILWAILRDGGTFDLQKAGIEEGTFEKTNVSRYRLGANTR